MVKFYGKSKEMIVQRLGQLLLRLGKRGMPLGKGTWEQWFTCYPEW